MRDTKIVITNELRFGGAFFWAHNETLAGQTADPSPAGRARDDNTLVPTALHYANYIP